MATPSQSDVKKQLAALQQAFELSIPAKLSTIEQLWGDISQAKNGETSLAELHRIVHSLSGSAGTFGAVSIGLAARDLEQRIKLLLSKHEQVTSLSSVSSEISQQVNTLILQLKQACENWAPSDIPYIKPIEDKGPRVGNLIYLVDDDELLAADLITKLERLDYKVKYFSSVFDFESACKIEMPVAIIMDMIFSNSDVAGADVIQKLKKEVDSCPPVVFISVRNDMGARLAAARAGATRYFCKPLDVKKLSSTLDGLTAQTTLKPYRALIIDDDETLLQYYATVLRDANIEVRLLSDPVHALEELDEFNPDIIISDVYMPNCSGPELAQVIRQDDTWAQTPIMFLSTESNLDRQLAAMNLGGDDFLVKPVEAGHLVSAVIARAKRARWTKRLNLDLSAALRESAHQTITSDQHDIVSSANVAGIITSVNDKFCEISGYSSEELIGKNHRILKSNHHPDSFYKEMWNTISSGQVWHGRICNINKAGEEYWVESTIVPFLDDKGKPYKYVSARTDVTKVIQSEARLERSQRFANIGTWDWNIKTGKLYWSERIWSLFGYDKEVTETTYENFMAAIHEDDRTLVSDAVSKCVESGKVYNIEHRVVWPDGSVHWLHESGDVVRDKDDQPLHMLGVVQDITLRKKTEMELAEQERQLLAAQSMASVGNWQADLSNGDLVWSDEIYRIFGYEPGSFEPSVKAFHQAIHPDDLIMVNESEKKAETTGKHDVEHRILQSDGSVRYVHELAEAETDEKGNLIKMSGTVQDITDRKLAEQSIISAREEAEKANRAKSEFLSSMSHELRTPMNAIMGFGQLLNMDFDNPLDDNQKENVTEILKASDHLLDLINEVLDLAKIEAGRIDLSIEDVSLSDVISESLQLILPLAEKRSISINLFRGDVEHGIDEIKNIQTVVRADYTRTKQVIINLLSNAVKYNSEKGNISIRCDVNESNIRISVTDTGNGLSLEQQSQLFTAFNRLGAENDDIEGTGIGLVITQNIVELMGGTIGIDSEVGKGSTFWFELPNSADSVTNKSEEKNIDNVEIAFEELRSVLYIEDNPANLRLVTQLLSRLPNLHMWTAHEPILGLELAASHQPDLILLDINLPGLDGFEVLKLLKERESTRNTPILAISANAMPRDIERGLEAGFDDYITKPININELLRSVDKHLSSPE